ncbi:hypothetical protein [Dyadobacter sp. Leaf189]|uniref:hypothetical protein n=1 Tax=Dyadobacter sp. Leaf189 TaxID=1736295 RepID=UPI0006F1C674|nr:hypothetical protein [Dyadobacter sp. Leaf189]KQS33817.1 hypothetical protein ASG33_07150 [Dyadobacter sp. Leaf189]
MRILPFFLFSLFHVAFGQAISREAELEVNDSAYHSIEVANMLFGAEGNAAVPKSFSMRMYCPVSPITATGGLGWSAAIGKAMSIQVGIERKWNREQTEKYAFSPYFLFDMLPKSSPVSCKLQKDWMRQTQDLLTKVGIVRLADYREKAADCHRQPSMELLNGVDRFRIRAMTRLFTSDQINAQQSIGQKQFVMKRSLGRKHPVVLCMLAGEAFEKLKTDQWVPRASAQELRTVVVTGYDDQKQAFEITHPAGKNWGRGGFAWLRYADLAYAKYAFEITMEDGLVPAQKSVAQAPARQQTLTGNSTSKHAAMRGSLQLNVVNEQGAYVPVILNLHADGYYETGRGYDVQSQFRLVGSATASSFLYVVGVDPEGGAQLHYPYQKKTDAGVTEHSSPLLAEAGSEVVIPEPVLHYEANGRQTRREQVFIKEQAGTDWLLAIYSATRRDREIESLVEKLKGHSADFPLRLQQVFGEYLAPKSLINFDKEHMKFVAGALPERFVVPIILKLEGH